MTASESQSFLAYKSNVPHVRAIGSTALVHLFHSDIEEYRDINEVFRENAVRRDGFSHDLHLGVGGDANRRLCRRTTTYHGPLRCE